MRRIVAFAISLAFAHAASAQDSTIGRLPPAINAPVSSSSIVTGLGYNPAKPIAPVSHQWLKSIGTDGGPTLAQPDVSDVTGAFPTAGGALTGPLALSMNSAVSAAGTTQSDATVLTSQTSVITTCATGAGVKIPVALNVQQLIINKTKNYCIIYPPSSAAIDAYSTNSPVAVASGGQVPITCISSTQCQTGAL